MHAKKLLTTVKEYADFPVLLETYRTCLVDEFDLAGAAHACSPNSRAAKFASPTVATQARRVRLPRTSRGDRSPATCMRTTRRNRTHASALSDDLIRAAVFDAALRPRVERSRDRVVRRETPTHRAGLCADGRRRSLGEWLKERVLIPERGVDATRAALVPDAATSPCIGSRAPGAAGRCIRNSRAASPNSCTATVDENLVDVGDPRDRVQLLREVLSFYGPLDEARDRGADAAADARTRRRT